MSVQVFYNMIAFADGKRNLNTKFHPKNQPSQECKKELLNKIFTAESVASLSSTNSIKTESAVNIIVKLLKVHKTTK